MSAKHDETLQHLLERIKAMAVETQQSYHTSELNRHLLRLCRERASACIIETLITMGATAVTEGLLELLNAYAPSSAIDPHMAMFWQMARSEVDIDWMRVLIQATSLNRYDLAANVFGVLQSKNKQAVAALDCLRLLQIANKASATDWIRMLVPYVQDADTLNDTLHVAFTYRDAPMVTRLVRAGATRLDAALVFFCSAGPDYAGDIHDLLIRGVKPTADCLNALVSPYRADKIAAEWETRLKLARIVSWFVDRGLPLPEPDTHARSIVVMLSEELFPARADWTDFLRPPRVAVDTKP